MEDKDFFDLAKEYRKQYPEIQNFLRIFENAEPYLVQLDKLNRKQNQTITVISDTKGGLYGPQKIEATFITKTGSTAKNSVPERAN